MDGDSGLVHTVVTTAANASDVSQVEHLLHGKETRVHGDAGYIGAEKRVAAKRKREWHIAEKRGRVKAMEEGPLKEATKELETLKARYRARVEHPFRVVKRQFGFQKVRFKGLLKNTAPVMTLFALSNLWMARGKLLAMTGQLRPQPAQRAPEAPETRVSGQKALEIPAIFEKSQKRALRLAFCASIAVLFRPSLSRCRISTIQQLRLLELFVAQATARTAADLVGIHRNSAALYYHKLRQHITACMAEVEPELAVFECDESYF